MEVDLSLPAVVTSLGNGDGVVVVTTLEECLKGSRLLVAPSRIRIIVERHDGSDALPHIEVAVRIEALEDGLCLSTGEDEAPGDAAVGCLIDEHQLGGCQGLNAELRILILCIRTDIGESRVGSQLDIGLLRDVAVGILPVIHLETPSRGLVTDGGIPVCILMAPLRGTCVHVGQTIGTSIVVEGAALTGVGREGDTVVIHTEILLVVGLCRPPLRTCCSGRAAAEVSHFLVGKTPLLVAEATEVGRVIDLGLVEGEGL